MTGVITLLLAGSGTGPFYVYSNVDGYTIPFLFAIPKDLLLAGYPTDQIPDGTTIVRLTSFNDVCNNSIDVVVPPQTCYDFKPSNAAYLTDRIGKDTTGYFYGAFTGYEETDIITTSHDLIKLNSDLTIDNSFDVGVGFNQVLFTGSSIIEQADGKLIVSGSFTSYQGVAANRIIRLNTNGTRDNTFVIGTGFNNLTQHIRFDSNEKIIVTGLWSSYNGTSANRLVRLNTDGTLDATLAIGTGFNNTTVDVLINPDDSMYVTGYFTTYKGVNREGLIKLDSLGNVDETFVVGAGLVSHANNNPAYLARIPGETSFYAAGFFTTYKGVAAPRIIKIDQFGDKDVSFNPGTGFSNSVTFIQVVWGDKLFVTGYFGSYNGTSAVSGFIILNADGSVYYSETSATYYKTPIIIGNNLFGAEVNGCLELLHTYAPITTTTTSTTIPVTTTTTTVAPTTTTSTTATPTTTTTTTAEPTTTTTTTAEPTTTTTTTVAVTPIKYGALYNWYAVSDFREIAPVGFHTPTSSELATLMLFIDPGASWVTTNVAGGPLKETGLTYWDSPNTGATDAYNFKARGSGVRGDADGTFTGELQTFSIWASDAYDATQASTASLFYDEEYLNARFGGAMVIADFKQGKSLRFIADSGTPTTVVGNDGKIYPCVTIGGQTWTASNCNETKYRNGDWIHGYDGGSYTTIPDPAWAASMGEAMCYYDDDEGNG